MLKDFYKKYEHRLSIGAFFLGFIIDNLTLTRIDLWLDNLILGSYIVLAALSILLFQVVLNKEKLGYFSSRLYLILPLIIQFAFGGLFSGYFVFYSRSASFATSWIFVILILALLIGNEVFKKRYARLEFQVSIFFITLFSFSIFYIPILFNEIGVWVFMLSGLVSLVLIWIFVKILGFVIKEKARVARQKIFTSIFSIYVIFNILYFTNIIPPIPLSMKDAGVFYLVERLENGNYNVLTEDLKWYEFYKKYDKKFVHKENEPVYFFSSVFAPTDLNTNIYHKWEYYDEIKGEWIENHKISFKIYGGRDGGYRGYSVKNNIFEGKWRVDVLTERNQIVGRATFNVSDVKEEPVLKRELR